MAPFFSTGKSPFWTGLKNKFGKILKFVVIIIVVTLISAVWWKYFYTYSEGYRAGYLQKFSSRGAMFKTYEGELILSSISSNKDVVLASEKFQFTMINKDLVRSFDTLQGNMVIIHYRQKNGTLPWRGDTPYLVDSIRLKK
jgi:hypothetical protein